MSKPGRWPSLVLGLAALVALGLTFLAYLNPHLARDLAAGIWACF